MMLLLLQNTIIQVCAFYNTNYSSCTKVVQIMDNVLVTSIELKEYHKGLINITIEVQCNNVNVTIQLWAGKLFVKVVSYTIIYRLLHPVHHHH